MKNWFNHDDADDLLRRLDGLTPDLRPRWGRFTPGAVVCHLADPIRVALGEKPAGPVSGPFAFAPLAAAVVWWLPWPKGAPTAPEFHPERGMTVPRQFDADKRALVDILRRLSQTPPDAPLSPSPVFGRLSHRGWGRVTWRHLDHHLRQFGL